MHDAPPLGGHGWPGRLLWVARRAANNNLPPAMAHQFPREVEGDGLSWGGLVCVCLPSSLTASLVRSRFRLEGTHFEPFDPWFGSGVVEAFV